MILVIDIGNTNVVFGICEGERVRYTGRCASDLHKTEDEYALTTRGILSLCGVSPADIEGGIISSVVPSLRNVLHRAMERLTGHSFLQVGSGIKTGLRIRMENPALLGSDLVADAVAAVARYPLPLVIFDLGSATTLSVVDASGCYLGGMIIPGVQVAADALSRYAAQLPAVPLESPARMIGKNTLDCMQSGAVYGHAAMLDGLLSRVEEELGSSVTAIATGGFAELIVPHCRRTITVDAELQLRGLLILYHKNQKNRR